MAAARNLTRSNEAKTAAVASFQNGGPAGVLFMNSGIPRGFYQRDFVSSIMKMFNLYIVEDSTKEKHLKIIPFID